jgi:serine/threonine protein kinase
MVSAAIRIDDGPDIEHFADELKAGVRLMHGHYEIDSFLNAGGFGIAYIARDSLDRRVVIKECFPSSFCRRSDTNVGPRSRQREDEFRSIVELFKQEALNLANLDHPNIVRVHQVFDENQTAYMAMDYIQGPDLLETIEGSAPRLSPAQVMTLLTKLLDALGYVHAQGFLHRDISPDNILLDKATGEPVLIDFGAARKEVTRKSRAVSGLRVVKDGYSPQEFYIAGSKQGPHSDFYALGASFCHLITGEAPKTSQERLAAIANGQMDPQVPVLGRVKGYPKGFLSAIDKAMSIFPKDRMQSASEWQACLRDLPATGLRIVRDTPHEADPSLARAPRPAAPDLVEAPTAAPPSQPTVRSRAVAALALALCLSGLVAVERVIGDRAETAQGAHVPAGEAAIVDELRVGGFVFQMIASTSGLRTVVAALPEGGETDLQVGDILLSYAATGETLSTETALRDVLLREQIGSIATYGFTVQRNGGVAIASLTLTGAD